jgi:hypothetical protein
MPATPRHAQIAIAAVIMTGGGAGKHGRDVGSGLG